MCIVGPVDFRGIQSLVPSSVCADPSVTATEAVEVEHVPTSSARSAPLRSTHASENRPPAGLDSCRRLHRFAEANGVEPDSILGGHKRKSDPSMLSVDAPGAKRPCTDVLTHSASTGGSCGHQQAPDVKRVDTQVGGISMLADQLPGLRGATMGTQCMTQPLHLSQCEPVQQPVVPAAGLLGSAQSVQDPLQSARVRFLW